MAAGTTVISTKPRPHQFQQVASQLTPADYEPVFPQAADLTDHDAALLRQLLNRSLQQDNYVLLNETANKIKGLLHVESTLSDEEFLRTVLRDHAHLLAAGSPTARRALVGRHLPGRGCGRGHQSRSGRRGRHGGA
nr:hypothetical protein [Tanacetum cinerariifolium]